MPELPEVETVVRTLRPRLVGRTVQGARVLRASAIGRPDPATFAGTLAGERVEGVERRGKYILIELESGRRLVAHLRMTGQFAFRPAQARPDGHTRAVLDLDGGEALHFIDQRTFGKLYLLPDRDTSPIPGLAGLGPEPLADDFTPGVLQAALSRTRRAIKSALLDQTLVAGVGNIYADEALFAAGIHPERPAASLTAAETARLHGTIRQALEAGIRHRGTTFAHFRNAEGEAGGNQVHLAVYGRAGEPCVNCGNPLHRRAIGGRTAHFCMTCQPAMG